MCTLTWKTWSGGYELHFNRDESRARPRAELPQIKADSAPGTIKPRDSAGGTWISVNQFGLSLCLLNNYLAANRYQGTLSRGLLVQTLSIADSLEQATTIFRDLNPAVYSPFDLVIFTPDQIPVRISWDGETISETSQNEPFISSSGYDTRTVINGRREQLLNSMAADLAVSKHGTFDLKTVSQTSPNLEAFHKSHIPERSGYSVCMHRQDAKTQSYSKIGVDEKTCNFWYTDGPPCKSALQGPWSISRLR